MKTKIIILIVIVLGPAVALLWTSPKKNPGLRVWSPMDAETASFQPQVISESREPISESLEPVAESGLRPEVSEILRARYSSRPELYARAIQAAKAFQLILDQNESDEFIRDEILREVACRSIRLPAREALHLGREIEALTFDSENRIDLYMKWNAQWDGQFIRAHALEESACDS